MLSSAYQQLNRTPSSETLSLQNLTEILTKQLNFYYFRDYSWYVQCIQLSSQELLFFYTYIHSFINILSHYGLSQTNLCFGLNSFLKAGFVSQLFLLLIAQGIESYTCWSQKYLLSE